MLHAIKKKVSQVATTTVLAAEFTDYEQRLSSTKKTLAVVHKLMNDNTKEWTRQFMNQRVFSTVIVEGYPRSEDDTHQLARTFADCAQDRYDFLVRENSPEMHEYNRLQNEVRAYIDEITAVEAQYSDIITAKSEVDRYRHKMDVLASGKRATRKANTVKKERNLLKLDAAAEKYRALCDVVIASQKKTFEKAATVYKMALCSYWLNNALNLAVANQSLERTKDWAKMISEELKGLTVAGIVSEGNTAHRDVPSNLPMSPPSSMMSSQVEKDSAINTVVVAVTMPHT
jgi:hypothetical protein